MGRVRVLLGARFGSAATGLVDEGEIKISFGAMLLLGSVAVGIKQLGTSLDEPPLRTGAMVLILLAALPVGGAVVRSSVQAIRAEERAADASAAD